jgi:hypothetical protein
MADQDFFGTFNPAEALKEVIPIALHKIQLETAARQFNAKQQMEMLKINQKIDDAANKINGKIAESLILKGGTDTAAIAGTVKTLTGVEIPEQLLKPSPEQDLKTKNLELKNKALEEGKNVTLQEKGVTEFGHLPISYVSSGKNAGQQIVTHEDGTQEVYNLKKHGNSLSTSLSQATVYNTQQVKDYFNNDPGALRTMAANYLSTGVIPMGFSGVTGRLMVAGQASKLMQEQGLDPAQAPQIRAEYEAGKKSLGQLTTQKNAVMAFEKTADKNINLALERSGLVGRSQSPAFNKWVLWAQGKGAGDKDVLALDAAIHVAANEIAKVTSTTTGNLIPQQEREEYRNLINMSLGKNSLQEVMDVIKKDMSNRETSYNEQIGEIQKSLNVFGIKEKPKDIEKPKDNVPILKVSPKTTKAQIRADIRKHSTSDVTDAAINEYVNKTYANQPET